MQLRRGMSTRQDCTTVTGAPPEWRTRIEDDAVIRMATAAGGLPGARCERGWTCRSARTHERTCEGDARESGGALLVARSTGIARDISHAARDRGGTRDGTPRVPSRA